MPRSEPAAGLTGGKVVKVDRAEWVSIPEAATAAAALVAGEIDYIEAINNDQQAILKKSGTVVVEPLAPLGWFGMLRPNALYPPFNNAKARQALALMVDQQEYMQAAFGGGQNCFSYFTCGSPNGTEVGSEAYRKPDFAKAKQLMAEAGYKGEKIVLMGAGDLFHHHAVAQVTAERLKEIGINVDLQMADWGAVVTRRGNKGDPYAGGWHIFQTFSDGVTGYSPLTNFGTNLACDGKNWFGWTCDEEAEKLRDRFIRAANETEQAQALELLHRRLWEVVPYVMLGKYERLAAWRSNIQGVLKANVLALWNISKRGGQRPLMVIKPPASIGFIGLGNMGAPMARRLLGAGFRLRLYDRDEAALRRFADCSEAAPSASPAALAAAVDAVITMLPDGKIVREAVLGADGLAQGLRPGSVIVDMSSSDPVGTRELGQALAARGLNLIDAPVSGGVKRALDGSLASMVGGEKAVVERVRPLIEPMARQIFPTGPLGSGHAMKALNNLVSAAGLWVAAEALLIGQGFGLSAEIMIDVLNASTGRNNSTENKFKQQILSRGFASGFSIGLMAKDLSTAHDLATATGSFAPYSLFCAELWGEAARELGEDADHTAAVRFLERRAGKELKP